ncbi:MAG: preprotein translocase subunit SecG, partial [Halieaceae bacterium]|nr:preprotein translocase subunit SecG [Halieaceae bacterium]
FFVSSFGLAVIADNRTASEDDLGFEVPVYEPVETEVPDSDVPDIDFGSEGDIPFDDAPLSSGE